MTPQSYIIDGSEVRNMKRARSGSECGDLGATEALCLALESVSYSLFWSSS
jgi:hypothetical protein